VEKSPAVIEVAALPAEVAWTMTVRVVVEWVPRHGIMTKEFDGWNRRKKALPSDVKGRIVRRAATKAGPIIGRLKKRSGRSPQSLARCSLTPEVKSWRCRASTI
jgi:hypothetical protein